jgi:type I restriction enzyme, S subunit
MGEVTCEPMQRVPAASEEFNYIDIASVDREVKAITSPQHLRGDKAPSRARKVVRTGDVLVSMTRPNLNAVALVPRQFDGQIASTGFDVLRPNCVDPRWIFGIVRSSEFVNAMSDLVQGALYPAVRSRDIRAYKIPIAPLPEQKRIADKLDTILSRVDACRDRLARVPQILKKFREAVLEAAVSGRLTERWRQRQQLVALGGNGRGVPPGWVNSTFNAITESSLYGPRFSSSDYIPDGVPTLRTTDMDAHGRIAPKNPPRVRISAANLERLGLKNGDLVMTRTGATIGKCAIFEDCRGPALPSAYLIRFRLHQEVVVPRFALLFLLAPVGQRLLFEGSTSTAQPNINAQRIRTFPIALPSLDEQAEVVRRVEDLLGLGDTLERRFRDARDKLEEVQPAVLSKAFRGELVLHDPNDESAKSLLERIQAARSTKAKNISRAKSPKAKESPNARRQGRRRLRVSSA